MVSDPYDQCDVCGRWHYTHGDESHAFVPQGNRVKSSSSGWMVVFEDVNAGGSLLAYFFDTLDEARREYEAQRRQPNNFRDPVIVPVSEGDPIPLRAAKGFLSQILVACMPSDSPRHIANTRHHSPNSDKKKQRCREVAANRDRAKRARAARAENRRTK